MSNPLLQRIINELRGRVLLMPIASTREEYLKRAPLVIELAEKYIFS